MLVLLINTREADSSLVLNVDVDHLIGKAAYVLILIMLVVVIISTGSAMSSYCSIVHSRM